MAREYTQQELQNFQASEKELRAVGLVSDEADGATEMHHNTERILAYFASNPHIPVTATTILQACEQMRSQLHWLSPIQREYRKLAADNPAAAQLVSDWYANQNILVRDDPNQALANQTILLTELHGREITSTTIHQAIGRAGQGRGLHYIQAPRPVDPRKHSESGAFMPKEETNLSARDHARKTQQARAESTPAPTQSNMPDAWESLCRNLLAHGTHGCQSAMRELYERRGSKSWRELHREMDQVKKSYERLVRY
jgi:hypothetical protein